MPVAPSDGPDLHYEVSGSGPRLLFLNGSGVTLEDSGLMLAGLASRFEVLAFDYRGLGRSGEVTAPWSSAPVVGISFGGMVALELVVSYPQRVERLALLCTSAGGRGGSSFPLHELEGLDPEVRLARRRILMDTRFDPAWLDSHPDDRRLVAMMESRGPGPDHPGRAGIHEQLQARRTHDTWDRLAGIGCPTFIGCGRFDGIAPLRNSEAMASEIPGAELHAYPGGHAFLAQAPESFEDVARFLLAAPS